MPEEMLKALLLLAGIPYTALFKIENGYCSIQPDSTPSYIEYVSSHPWWLVRTEFGLLKIGWRKRVIAIDWSDTPIRNEVTKDDVTKSDTDVHAWGYGMAVIYLQNWQRFMDQHKWRVTHPAEAAAHDTMVAEYNRQEAERLSAVNAG